MDNGLTATQFWWRSNSDRSIDPSSHPAGELESNMRIRTLFYVPGETTRFPPGASNGKLMISIYKRRNCQTVSTARDVCVTSKPSVTMVSTSNKQTSFLIDAINRVNLIY